MNFPLNFWDISLWLAIIAIILLVTSELISPYYGHRNILLNKKKLRSAALIWSTIFIVIVLVRLIVNIIGL